MTERDVFSSNKQDVSEHGQKEALTINISPTPRSLKDFLRKRAADLKDPDLKSAQEDVGYVSWENALWSRVVDDAPILGNIQEEKRDVQFPNIFREDIDNLKMQGMNIDQITRRLRIPRKFVEERFVEDGGETQTITKESIEPDVTCAADLIKCEGQAQQITAEANVEDDPNRDNLIKPASVREDVLNFLMEYAQNYPGQPVTLQHVASAIGRVSRQRISQIYEELSMQYDNLPQKRERKRVNLEEKDLLPEREDVDLLLNELMSVGAIYQKLNIPSETMWNAIDQLREKYGLDHVSLPWIPHYIQVLKLKKDGFKNRQVAQRLNLDIKVVHSIVVTLREGGVVARERSAYRYGEELLSFDANVWELIQQGFTYAQVAEKLSVPLYFISSSLGRTKRRQSASGNSSKDKF